MISRAARGVPAADLEWAAIDLETTGLEPRRAEQRRERLATNLGLRGSGWLSPGQAVDPDGDSVVLIKARELGLKVVSVAEATQMVDRQIAVARTDEAEQIAASRQWQQDRAEREQFFRYTWLRNEQLHAMEFADARKVRSVAAKRPDRPTTQPQTVASLSWAQTNQP